MVVVVASYYRLGLINIALRYTCFLNTLKYICMQRGVFSLSLELLFRFLLYLSLSLSLYLSLSPSLFVSNSLFRSLSLCASVATPDLSVLRLLAIFGYARSTR